VRQGIVHSLSAEVTGRTSLLSDLGSVEDLVHAVDFGGDVGDEPPFGHGAQWAVEVELFPMGDSGARWCRGGSDIAVEGDEPDSARRAWR